MNNKTLSEEPQIFGAKRIPAPEGTTYTLNGKEFPVKWLFRLGNMEFPLVDIPMMSDYKWQFNCLLDRLEHPEKYREFENVEETIERLKKWLVENEDKAEPTDPLYNDVFGVAATA